MHNPCLLANKALLHAPTPAHTAHNARHLAHNCEGGRLGYALKSLSGHNPCLRSPSQEGRALGGEYRSSWDGRGLRANSHLHHICEACLHSAAQRRGRLAHTCPTRPKKSISEHQTRVLAAHRWRHLPLVTRDLHILPICQC